MRSLQGMSMSSVVMDPVTLQLQKKKNNSKRKDDISIFMIY